MISWNLSRCLQPPEELFVFKGVSWRIIDMRPGKLCSNACSLLKDWILEHGVLGLTISTEVVTGLMASYRRIGLLPAPQARSMNSIPKLLHLECCPLSAISICWFHAPCLGADRTLWSLPWFPPVWKDLPLFQITTTCAICSIFLLYNYLWTYLPYKIVSYPRERTISYLSFFWFIAYLSFFFLCPILVNTIGAQ